MGLLEKRTSAQSIEGGRGVGLEDPGAKALQAGGTANAKAPASMYVPSSIHHIFHAFTWPFIEFKGVRGKCLLGHLSHCARSSFGQGPHNGQLHSHPTGHPDMSRRAHTQTYTPTLVQRDLCTAAIEKGSVIV